MVYGLPHDARATSNQDARAGPSTWRCRREQRFALKVPAVRRQDNPRIACCCCERGRPRDHQQAISYLIAAPRGKLLGMQSTNSSETPTVGGCWRAEPLYRRVANVAAPTQTASPTGSTPWRLPSRPPRKFHAAGIQRTDRHCRWTPPQTRMLRQVDTAMESLQENLGWLQGMDVRADATANRAPAS